VEVIPKAGEPFPERAVGEQVVLVPAGEVGVPVEAEAERVLEWAGVHL
jgi:hypothetical protein